MDKLARAARVFIEARKVENEAKAALAAAQATLRAAHDRVAQAREPLAAEIVCAAKNRVRQKDILARIDNAYTREQVRRICRAAGLGPDD